MHFGCSFTQKQHFGILKMLTFEKSFEFMKTIMLLSLCKLQKC